MIDTQNRLWGTGSFTGGQLFNYTANQSSPVLLSSDLYWISLSNIGTQGTSFVGIADDTIVSSPTPTPSPS